jgi:hypothetical protein
VIGNCDERFLWAVGKAASFAGEAVRFPYSAGASENADVGNGQFFAIFSQPILGEVAEWSKAALC